MSVDRIILHRAARNIEESPEYEPISKVRIVVGQDEQGMQLVYEAGDDTWRTLEIENPWGTQAMADAIYARVKGYAYKPYRADGAHLNPAAELGDAVNVGDVYSFIASSETTFSTLMTASISAPEDSDIDHEYPYETKESREISRRINGVKTSFIVELGRIRAEISDEYETKNDSEYKYQSLSSAITLTAEGIMQSVSATYETKTSSAAKLADAKGYTDSTKRTLETTISQTASGITQSVSETYETKTASASKLNEAKGYTDSTKQTLETTIAQTATSITQSVSATYETKTEANAQYTALNSVIEQTASSITQTVSSNYATKSALSTVQQTANKINWLVQSGTSAANFTLTPRAISLVANTIDLTGFVTFSSLSTAGSTSIDGANINTENLIVRNVFGAMKKDGTPSQIILRTDGSAINIGSYGYKNPDFNVIRILAKKSVLIGTESWATSTSKIEFNIENHQITPGFSNLYSWSLGTTSYPFGNVATSKLLLYYTNTKKVQLETGSGSSTASNSIAIYPNTEFDIGNADKRVYGVFARNANVLALTASSATLGAAADSVVTIGDGYRSSVLIGSSSTGTYASKLAFFGATPIVRQALSTSSTNMGYSSATESNYLIILNNIAGILKNKYGLIG